MVNAGAIAATGLVQGRDVEERWARIHGVLEAFAGRPLKVDDAVALSERETGHRNRAIAHLMRNFDMVRSRTSRRSSSSTSGSARCRSTPWTSR